MQYGWTVEYILDLPYRQVERLVEAASKRLFRSDILVAQYQEVAILRALASTFGKKGSTLPPWPTWEDAKREREPPNLSAGMARLRKRARGD